MADRGIELRRLGLEREKAAVDRSRLQIEEAKLEVERRRFNLEKVRVGHDRWRINIGAYQELHRVMLREASQFAQAGLRALFAVNAGVFVALPALVRVFGPESAPPRLGTSFVYALACFAFGMFLTVFSYIAAYLTAANDSDIADDKAAKVGNEDNQLEADQQRKAALQADLANIVARIESRSRLRAGWWWCGIAGATASLIMFAVGLGFSGWVLSNVVAAASR
jgi:hypothetical protein